MDGLFTVRELDKIVIVDIHEQLIKEEQYGLLKDFLLRMMEKGKHVAVNLTTMPRINSGIINIFIVASKRIHDFSKELYLVSPSENAEALFYVNNLDRILNIVKDEKELPV